jgi:hypothetical protein
MSDKEINAATDTGISFAEFLESTPPGEIRRVKDLRVFYVSAVPIPGRGAIPTELANLSAPQIYLPCPSDECDGHRFFRVSQGNIDAPPGVGIADKFIQYTCSNCGKCEKTFALRLLFPLRDDPRGDCMKFGEIPAYGPPTPTRLLRLFGEDREVFLKGRRSENQGLGIGAFAYYRRIVERHKNQILDEIIKVANRVAPEMVQAFEGAKRENQFLKAVESVKGVLPQTLLINGHNPLTLLHSALSAGLHEQTDERCLDLAQAVRVVLADLAERIGQALKDDAELTAAISRLTKPD